LHRTLLPTVLRTAAKQLRLGSAVRLALAILMGFLVLSASQSNAQIFHKKKKINKSIGEDNSVQPDKVLYDRALEDIRRGRHETGRLNLQTLINTYPDSEFLAKAKLSIADSYFKEGGTANMTQAISGYKDFIVFFPFLPEASYAQLQVATAHFRQMEKPDRDRTQAHEAEDEFQTFLQKYPNDPLAPKAMQRLREVQEVLAEGDYRVGRYYFVKGDRRAAAARLISVTRRYPLFSRADRALWMLGDIFEKSEKKEIATVYYSQIVKNYPLSGYASGAKEKLMAMNVPVPQPDPKAVARMTADQNAPRPRSGILKKSTGLFKTGPEGELHAAAQVGEPTMQPEVDNTSATDVLTGGNQSRIGGGPSTGIVATVTPGGSAETPAGTESSTPGSDASAPNGEGAAPPATDANPDAAAKTANEAEAGADAVATPGTDPAAGAVKTDGARSADATKTEGAQQDPQKGKKESSSKKKKGVRKIIPW